MINLIYGKAFNQLVENAKWLCHGDGSDYNDYEWLDSRKKPTKSQCDSIIPDIINDTQIVAAKELRRVAYQLEADPLFFKAQAGEDGVTLEQWEVKRQEIKDRYPYPTA